MAVGSCLLDELFSQTGLNKAVVCYHSWSVESPLSLLNSNHLGRHEAAISYMVKVPGQGGSSS